jgi:hypothetical protein
MKLTNEDNGNPLDNILGDSITNFLRSHALRIKLPLWSAVASVASNESARDLIFMKKIGYHSISQTLE